MGKLANSKSVLFIMLLATCTILISNNASAQPPTDFARIDILGPTTNLAFPVSFDFTPDGKILVVEKKGDIKLIDSNGTVHSQLVLDIRNKVDTLGERGLLGLALDPNFSTNPYIYVFYTNLSPNESHVSRFTVNNWIADPNSELVYLKTTTPRASYHQGGGLRTSDGYLWATFGEDGQKDNNNMTITHNPDIIDGKLVRLNLDGTIPHDNPYVNTTGFLPQIWSYGLRNPYKFSMLPSGIPIVGDVGQNTWEEVLVATKGADFTWPKFSSQTAYAHPPDGPCYPNTICSYTNPIYAFNHNISFPDWTSSSNQYSSECPTTAQNQSVGVGCYNSAVTGGLIVPGVNYPSQYQGMYFFGDYARGFISTLQLDSSFSTVIGSASIFDRFAGSVVDFRVGPDGNLYYLTVSGNNKGANGFTNSGTIFKYVYSQGIHPPIVFTDANVTSGSIPLSVQFSSQGTTSQDSGTTLSYLWNFGDGATSSSQNPIHVYNTPGTFIATLNVTNTNSQGSSASATGIVDIVAGDKPPKPVILLPLKGLLYHKNQIINFSGFANDANGNPIPASNLTWTVIFHHAFHTHPGLADIHGNFGSFSTSLIPEQSLNQSYETILSAVDSHGLSNQTSIFIHPDPAAYLNLTSNSILTLNSIPTVPWGNNVITKGRLVDQSSVGIGSKTITYTCNGATTSSQATTLQNGSFSLTCVSPHTVGNWKVNATFGGDSSYKATSTVQSYNTIRHASSLSLFIIPGNYTVYGRLTDTMANTGIDNTGISFSVDSPLTIPSTSTNSSGSFIAKIMSANSNGSYHMTAQFGGNALYNASSSQSKTITVTISNSQNSTVNLVDLINNWVGYSPNKISDAKLLSDMGLHGNIIPYWEKKMARFVESNDITVQEFYTSVQYLCNMKIII